MHFIYRSKVVVKCLWHLKTSKQSFIQDPIQQKLLERIQVSGERETIDVPVEAYCNYMDEPEHIATFSLGLSLKDKGAG
jgi:hypothetical protein